MRYIDITDEDRLKVSNHSYNLDKFVHQRHCLFPKDRICINNPTFTPLPFTHVILPLDFFLLFRILKAPDKNANHAVLSLKLHLITACLLAEKEWKPASRNCYWVVLFKRWADRAKCQLTEGGHINIVGCQPLPFEGLETHTPALCAIHTVNFGRPQHYPEHHPPSCLCQSKAGGGNHAARKSLGCVCVCVSVCGSKGLEVMLLNKKPTSNFPPLKKLLFSTPNGFIMVEWWKLYSFRLWRVL